jgi:hypothetical protein
MYGMCVFKKVSLTIKGFLNTFACVLIWNSSAAHIYISNYFLKTSEKTLFGHIKTLGKLIVRTMQLKPEHKYLISIWPPPPQLFLHRKAALSSNSNGTRSIYSRENPKAVYIVRCLWARATIFEPEPRIRYLFDCYARKLFRFPFGC